MSVTTKIHVGGMSCSSCTNSISSELKNLSGVNSVSISLITEEAVINHSSNVKSHDLIEKIEDLGFDASLIETNQQEPQNLIINMNTTTTIIQVNGMTCSSCSNSIINSLKNIPGIQNVNVSLLTEEATIIHDDYITTQSLIENIEDLGFDATLLSSISETNIKPKLLKTELNISGMTCTSCSNSIINELNKLSQVENISVSLMTEKAVIIHEKSLSVESIKDHIEDLGFDAFIINSKELNDFENSYNISNSNSNFDKISTNLKIFGMTDPSIENLLIETITNLNGILKFNFSFNSKIALIEYDSNIIGIRSIIENISNLGFDALIINKLDSTSQIDLLSKIKEINYWKKNVFNLLIAGIPILFLSHVLPLIISRCHWDSNKFKIINGLYWDIILQLLFGTYIQFWLGENFYINCYKSLSHGNGSMDVLICISTSIIYFYSLISIIHSIFTDSYPNILFDTSLMLLLFVSVGKLVESKAKGNTSTALSKLLSLAPSSCIIVENPEIFNSEKIKTLDSSTITQKTIGIDLLEKNDIAIILPGSKIPSDGICIFGVSEVDESLLTGESLPVKKSINSLLIGGSVNLSSTIFMKVTKLGEQTQLQQIVKLVKDAQISNAPVQRFSDIIASKFVPIILLFSSFSLIFWLLYVNNCNIKNIPPLFIDSKTSKNSNSSNIAYFKILQVAISVIVVACPCALGLAAPTAVMVGTGVGASNGVLIKGGEILENSSKVNCVIFDKTGTLTNGIMELINYKFLNNYKNKELFLWSLLHSIESNSEHPIAKAIVKSCNIKLKDEIPLSFEFSSIDTHIGLGISANCIDLNSKESINVKLGNLKFLKNSQILNENDFNNLISEYPNNNKISSICHILINNSYVGFVELSDSLKSDAKYTIETFIENGYSVGMVTGDLIETSKHVAKLLGIPLNNVLAEATPDQKLEYIKKLQDDLNLNVSFVGDGINDAPALVQSNVGVAISSGTDIAMSAADIILLSSTGNDDNDNSNSDDDSDNEESNNKSHIGLLGVYAGFDISSCTFTTIKLNFLLAVIYNLIMLPIAMGILIIPLGITMHPMFASAAMACSSISVVGNSLRLKNWSISKLKKNIHKNNNISNYNLGWNDGIADTRSNINEVVVDSFIINSHNQTRMVSFITRFKRWINSIFFRQQSNDYFQLDQQ